MSILAFVLILCFVFQALYQYLNLISASTVKDILRESLTLYVHIMYTDGLTKLEGICVE
jgi:hypothetical protein